MPSKNDLSALKGAAQRPAILPADDGRPMRADRMSSTVSGRVGRPPKPEGEKRSHKVTLSLTPSEGAKISEKAGLAGEATFLYAVLKEAGIFD